MTMKDKKQKENKMNKKQIINKIKKEMRKTFKLFPNSFFDFTDSSELAHKRIVKCIDDFNLSNKLKMDLDYELLDWYMKLKQRVLNKKTI